MEAGEIGIATNHRHGTVFGTQKIEFAGRVQRLGRPQRGQWQVTPGVNSSRRADQFLRAALKRATSVSGIIAREEIRESFLEFR
jgi:hypothetical protein